MAGLSRTSNESAPGVYTSLPELVRLQYKARGYSFLPRQPVHSLLTGRWAARVRGRGLNFEEIRRYVPGDDIRTIDWKVTARTGKTHTRVYTEERDRPQIMVVDQRLSMFFGTREAMKSVTAAELGALAAWRALSVGDRAGAIVFNDSRIDEVPPHRSRGRVMQILQRLVEHNRELAVDAGIEPTPGMLNRALDQVRRRVGHDYLVGVISDFEGADEDTTGILREIAQHNDVLVALIYDPAQTELPDRGRMVVSRGDLQFELDLGPATVRRAIAGFFPERMQRLKEGLDGLGVPVLPIHTAEGAAEQLRHLLGNRLGHLPGRPGARR